MVLPIYLHVHAMDRNRLAHGLLVYNGHLIINLLSEGTVYTHTLVSESE